MSDTTETRQADALDALEDVTQALAAVQALLLGDRPANDTDLAALLRLVEEAAESRIRAAQRSCAEKAGRLQAARLSA
jgi:hypothetical protein